MTESSARKGLIEIGLVGETGIYMADAGITIAGQWLYKATEERSLEYTG